MKTTYLTSLTATFNPFSRTAVVPRLVIQLLKPDSHKNIAIKSTQLPQTSNQPATLELGFKDGQKMTYRWAEEDLGKGLDKDGKKKKVTKLDDVVWAVDKHARILGRKEELSG